MGKRKSASKDERIRKKIRKLEEKLRNLPSCDTPLDNVAVDDESASPPRETHPSDAIYESPRLPPSLAAMLDSVGDPGEPIPGLSLVEPNLTNESTLPTICVENAGGQHEEPALEDDILEILGEAPKEESALGKNIHRDIATRWQEILKNGLSKETRDKLVEQYLIPANCKYLLAPELNPEAKAALPETLTKRDTMIKHKQGQLGIALTALPQVLEAIINNEASKQKILQPLSDACRILCDSHNVETKTRRSIVMSSINASLRDVLADTTRDRFLFGEDVSETLKIAKNVQKTGESLQRIHQKPTAKSNTQFRKNYLNYKGQHRKTLNKPENLRTRGAASTSSLPPQYPQRAPVRSYPYPPRTNNRERPANNHTLWR